MIVSILEQDYPNLEFFIIDGGSTDGSVEVIKKYSEKITHWVSEKDGGTFEAINKALNLFSGDYWCVVNSDDKLGKNCLHQVAYFLKQNTTDWLTGGIEFIDGASNKIGQSVPSFPTTVDGRYFLNECWIYHPVTFLSRKLFNEVGFFKNMDIMDYDYWIRAEEAGYIPVIIPEIMGSLRYHANCKSMDFLKIYKAKIDLLSEKLPLVKTDQLNRHLKNMRLSYLQTELKLLLFNQKYRKTAGLLLHNIIRNPAILTKRWSYGLLKRFFTGIEEDEVSPVYFLKNLS